MLKNINNNEDNLIIKKLNNILENKKFNLDTKNIILSCIYKLMLGYDDFKNIKILVEDKYVFFNTILEIISNKIININFLNALEYDEKIFFDKEKIKYIPENNEILIYKNDISFYYGILQIIKHEQKNNLRKDKLIYEIIGENIINGNIINLFDLYYCNGWNWGENSYFEQDNKIIDFLLKYVFGLHYLKDNKILKFRKYNSELVQLLFLKIQYIIYVNEKIIEVQNECNNNYFTKINKLKKIKIEINKTISKLEKNYITTGNEKYIQEIEIEKNILKNQKKIADYELLLSNIPLLKTNLAVYNKKQNKKTTIDEYIQKINEDKYVKQIEINWLETIILEDKKENIIELEQLNEIEKMIDKKIKNRINSFEKMNILEHLKNEELQDIIYIALKLNEKKIKEEIEIEKIIKYIKILRYIRFFKIDNQYIYENEQINNIIGKQQKFLIYKLLQANVIRNFFDEDNLNIYFLSKIFKLKIIDIKDICIEIKKDKVQNENNDQNKLDILFNIYDNDVLIKQEKLNISQEMFLNLKIKQNKKYKIFK